MRREFPVYVGFGALALVGAAALACFLWKVRKNWLQKLRAMLAVAAHGAGEIVRKASEANGTLMHARATETAETALPGSPQHRAALAKLGSVEAGARGAGRASGRQGTAGGEPATRGQTLWRMLTAYEFKYLRSIVRVAGLVLLLVGTAAALNYRAAFVAVASQEATEDAHIAAAAAVSAGAAGSGAAGAGAGGGGSEYAAAGDEHGSYTDAYSLAESVALLLGGAVCLVAGLARAFIAVSSLQSVRAKRAQWRQAERARVQRQRVSYVGNCNSGGGERLAAGVTWTAATLAAPPLLLLPGGSLMVYEALPGLQDATQTAGGGFGGDAGGLGLGASVCGGVGAVACAYGAVALLLWLRVGADFQPRALGVMLIARVKLVRRRQQRIRAALALLMWALGMLAWLASEAGSGAEVAAAARDALLLAGQAGLGAASLGLVLCAVLYARADDEEEEEEEEEDEGGGGGQAGSPEMPVAAATVLAHGEWSTTTRTVHGTRVTVGGFAEPRLLQQRRRRAGVVAVLVATHALSAALVAVYAATVPAPLVPFDTEAADAAAADAAAAASGEFSAAAWAAVDPAALPALSLTPAALARLGVRCSDGGCTAASAGAGAGAAPGGAASFAYSGPQALLQQANYGVVTLLYGVRAASDVAAAPEIDPGFGSALDGAPGGGAHAGGAADAALCPAAIQNFMVAACRALARDTPLLPRAPGNRSAGAITAAAGNTDTAAASAAQSAGGRGCFGEMFQHWAVSRGRGWPVGGGLHSSPTGAPAAGAGAGAALQRALAEFAAHKSFKNFAQADVGFETDPATAQTRMTWLGVRLTAAFDSGGSATALEPHFSDWEAAALALNLQAPTGCGVSTATQSSPSWVSKRSCGCARACV
jgi:hypothetical protein